MTGNSIKLAPCDSRQRQLFPGVLSVVRRTANRPSKVVFNDPSPAGVFAGSMLLSAFLKQTKQTDVFVVRDVLRGLDWSEFEKMYKAGGRPPYHPAALVSVVLLGLMEGKTSLRALERFCVTDLRCWWLTGGVFPDHVSLGRCLQRHAQQLTTVFFEDLTRSILRAIGSSCSQLAGDGTVVEAMVSRHKALTADALADAKTRAELAAQTNGMNAKIVEKVENLAVAQEVCRQRQQSSRAKGRDPNRVKVHPSEPDAVLQPLKSKRRALAYKPSALANSERIIVAQAVDPSNENKVVGDLLDQAIRIADQPIEEAMFDAGYFCEETIKAVEGRSINLLVPEGRTSTAGSWNKRSSKQTPKSAFTYHAADDCYICPQGFALTPHGRFKANRGSKAYVRYGGAPCTNCPLKSKCAPGKSGRRIKRYDIDDAKDRLRIKMSQPDDRLRYQQRQAMIEPVFSELKGIQRLVRFARRGLAAVRLEFSLHAVAHNLRRLLKLHPTQWTAIFASYARFAAILRRLVLFHVSYKDINDNVHRFKMIRKNNDSCFVFAA